MKRLFLVASLFLATTAIAQVDSNLLKVSVTMQARDWVYLNSFTANNDATERLHDSLKVRAQGLSNASATTNIKIDSVAVGVLLNISSRIRSQAYGTSVYLFNRINTAIRAVSNPYLQSQLDAMDASWQQQYNNTLQGELDRIKRMQ